MQGEMDFISAASVSALVESFVNISSPKLK